MDENRNRDEALFTAIDKEKKKKRRKRIITVVVILRSHLDGHLRFCKHHGVRLRRCQ